MISLTINNNTCTKCSRCVAVCTARILTQDSPKSDIGIVNLETCIDCGQCVAICPTNSVVHSSYPKEKLHDIHKELLPTPEALLELMRKRRSNRTFSKKEVPTEYLEKILEAASLAPTARNGRPLKFTLITNQDILNRISKTCIDVCEILVSKLANGDEMQKQRAALFQNLINRFNSGYEIILRYAKALILIHADEESASADANLAYQNASLMAESFDVAHFYTGYIRLISLLDTEGSIKKIVNIDGQILAGMALGIPQYKFDKYIDRKEELITRLI